MATDINTLLTDSLIYVGAYAQGQTANPDDLSLAFRVVNRKLDSLSAEKLSMVGMGRLAGQLSGQQSYALGPGLAWNASTRPIKIKSASTLATNGTEQAAEASHRGSRKNGGRRYGIRRAPASTSKISSTTMDSRRASAT